jgi:hypothetical protein
MDRLRVIIYCAVGVIAAVLIVVGLAEIVLGRRRIRTVAKYGVTGRTSWRPVASGVALALLATGDALGGWYLLLALAGLVIVGWSLAHHRRTSARPNESGWTE